MSSEHHLPALEDMRVSGLSDWDIALRAWALICDRSHAKTSRYLADEYRIDIKPNTIAVRARDHNWHHLADDLFHAAAPDKLKRMAVRALNASEEALSYLEDVAAGRAPTNEKGEIDKGRANVCLELVRIVGFVSPRANDVSVTGTSFQRAIGATTNHDDYATRSVEDIEAELARRGIRLPS